jgi:hypothetical protein
MQVVRQPRTGTSAEVHTDVEAVGLYRKSKRLLGIPYQLGHFEKLSVICLV